jgi:hypothetical protein
MLTNPTRRLSSFFIDSPGLMCTSARAPLRHSTRLSLYLCCFRQVSERQTSKSLTTTRGSGFAGILSLREPVCLGTPSGLRPAEPSAPAIPPPPQVGASWKWSESPVSYLFSARCLVLPQSPPVGRNERKFNPPAPMDWRWTWLFCAPGLLPRQRLLQTQLWSANRTDHRQWSKW